MSIPIIWFVFLGIVIVVGLWMWLTQRSAAGDGRGTRYFLVVLRLAIGWHILYEGFEKYSSPTWSGEAYLREASGPLAPEFRDLAGDSLLARLTPVPKNGLPTALEQDWQAYFTRFVRHYHLDQTFAATTVGATGPNLEQGPLQAIAALGASQGGRARIAFDQARSRTRTWLLSGTERIAFTSPYPPEVKVDKTVAQRVKDYQQAEQKVRSIEENDLPIFGSAAFAKLQEAKKDASTTRASLKSDLARQTADMRKALRDVLTPEQKEMPMPPDSVKWPIAAWGRLEWADAMVTYGLLAVGVCLMIGLLTRTACLAGAGFLLLFYLAMPALPDWPPSPRLEGSYLYVNKTLIEMFALLALATTRSGRWLGLDALLQFFTPSFWRSGPARPVEPVVIPQVIPTLKNKTPALAGRSKEIPHGT
jgi:thiosulfate dehydrogenase [quinone] large subunit